MIITLEEYKTLKGITGTTQDVQISATITIVESAIISFCNDDFEDVPGELKGIAADMVTFRLSGASGSGKKSESIDGYSYTRDETGATGYPLSIENSLAKYKKVSLKIGTKHTHWRDKRETIPE